jgi:hypothetical protein
MVAVLGDFFEPYESDVAFIRRTEEPGRGDPGKVVEESRAVRKELALPVSPLFGRVGLRIATPDLEDQRPRTLGTADQRAAAPSEERASVRVHPEPGERSVARGKHTDIVRPEELL